MQLQKRAATISDCNNSFNDDRCVQTHTRTHTQKTKLRVGNTDNLTSSAVCTGIVSFGASGSDHSLAYRSRTGWRFSTSGPCLVHQIYIYIYIYMQ